MLNDESVTTVKSNLCPCSHVDTTKVSEYVFSGVEGMTFVLHNAVTRGTCKDCGEDNFYIPNRPGLMAAAVVHRATIDLKLNGAEVRFFRKMMKFPAKALAEILEVTPEHLSRVENGKIPISNAGEKLLRVLAVRHLREAAPLVKCDETKILEMKIRALRADPMITMHFRLVTHRAKEDLDLEEVYVEQVKQAA